MNNNQFSKDAISHRELNNFLIKAQKDETLYDSPEQNTAREEQEFNNLIENWTATSQKILILMNNKDKFVTKNRSPKSLMAFGAMGAHINMALQALKATGSD